MNIVKDARGALITAGDTVTYFSGGRYTQIMTAKVIEVRVRVKLGDIDSLGSQSWGKNLNREKWADSTSLIVVNDLPVVAGRLNTGATA
jgi:hypothetical protein